MSNQVDMIEDGGTVCAAQQEPDTRALLRWLRAQGDVSTVTLACADAEVPHPPYKDVLVIWSGCVGPEELALLPQLLAEGARRVGVVLCPLHAQGQDDTPETETSRLLGSWMKILPDLITLSGEPDQTVRHGETVCAGSVPVLRRSLIGLPLTGPLDLSSDNHARTLQALRALVTAGRIPKPSTAPSGPLSTLPIAGLRLAADGCTMCAACTWACPDGALMLLEGSTDVHGLVHDVAACRGCQDCLAACPVGALNAIGVMSVADIWEGSVSVLTAMSTRCCEHCGHTFVEEGERLCPLCRARERSPFLSDLPPEAERLVPPHVLAAIRRSRGL